MYTDRTVVIVFTPVNYGFKESEIPIIITTEGPATGYKSGITLPALV